MASVTVRGKAVVEGIASAFDAILYAISQTGKATQNFEEEIIKDVHGFDTAWLFRNEHATADISLKLIGDTHAHAIIPATAVSPTGGTTDGATVSALGQPFLANGSQITFSGFDLTGFNGVWQVLSGGDVDLGNTKVADLALKVRKYADAGQQTLAATIPT